MNSNRIGSNSPATHRSNMATKEILLRFFGFLLPWVAFSIAQYYVLRITESYALMMYGGIAAILSLSARDSLLEVIERRFDKAAG